jgi:hypothetical protein
MPLLAFVIAVAVACGGGDSDESPRETTPPNFVLLIGGDHGWPFFGFAADSTTARLDGF